MVAKAQEQPPFGLVVERKAVVAGIVQMSGALAASYGIYLNYGPPLEAGHSAHNCTLPYLPAGGAKYGRLPFLRSGKRLSPAIMQPHQINDGKSKILRRGRGLLLLRVHFEVARMAPRAWLTALWWRVLGKRVRAHAQFAPLLSTSRHIYRLWLMTEPALPPSTADEPPIVALVSPGPGQADTLRSATRQGIMALAVEAATTMQAVTQIDWEKAPWLMPLAAGDLLAPTAAATYRSYAMAAEGVRDVRIIYADDDLRDGKGQRTAPHFKPSWNAELFRHFDYLTGSCILRASAIDLTAISGADWSTRLVNAAVAAGGDDPLRIPYVLHHRLGRPLPRSPEPIAAGMETLPKVTVIVPTRNRVDLLRTCIEGLGRTAYPDFEVIVVDNGSDDPATLDYLARLDPARHQVLRDDGPFNFSRLNNRAAKVANGALLCLLNNDIEILSPDWLAIMAHQALRPEVGAVGARLLYPDGRIQHAGVVLGICGGAAHAHRLLQPEDEGYFHRHALPQFVSAVTAACLVVQRERFEAVGGLDEKAFVVSFNDVDLCMRLNAMGWQSFYEPRATLVHHESVSRGLDRDPVGAARLAKELEALKARWGTGSMEGDGDPFHHPHLNRFSERFALQV